MTLHRPSDELLDRLAADYALGTMRGGARRRFERAMGLDARLAQAVMRWQQRLLPLDAGLPSAPAGVALWARIEREAFSGVGAVPAKAQRWWQRLLTPLPAGALAMGLLLGSLGPGLYRQLHSVSADTQLPASFIGVLASADGQAGLVVSSLRRGRVVDVKRIAALPTVAGRLPFLWTLDGRGQAQPVGPVPAFDVRGLARLHLAQPAEALFQRAVELAVSLEVVGSTPVQPAGAFIYRGLCAELWPPAAPARAALR